MKAYNWTHLDVMRVGHVLTIDERRRAVLKLLAEQDKAAMQARVLERRDKGRTKKRTRRGLKPQTAKKEPKLGKCFTRYRKTIPLLTSTRRGGRSAPRRAMVIRSTSCIACART